MKKTISIAAYNRPDNLTWLLRDLKAQLLPLNDYQLYIRIDRGGKNFDAVRAVAEGVDFIETHVTWPNAHLGMNLGMYESIRWTFEKVKADLNVYLEDDYLLSPDAFNLVEWYIKNGDRVRSWLRGDIAAYCLCNQAHEGGASPTEIVLRKSGGFWGFVMSQRQWFKYGRPGWFTGRPKTAGGRLTLSSDKRLAAYIRTFPRVYRAFPALSRVSNSGDTRMRCIPGGNEYVYDEEFKGYKYRYYNQERKVYPFHVVWG